ncbi:SprT family zinc-dependent metalloprotease [soil metagenome]
MNGPTTGRLTYSIRRSTRARRARLTVSEDGRAVVVLPARMTLREAALLVEQHAGWLERQLARVDLARAALAERPPLGEGRILEVAGTAYRTATVDVPAARPARGRVDVVRDHVVVRLGHDGRDAVQLLDGWLRAEARRVIAERVRERAQGMAVRPGRISIRDQRSRWASASAGGALSFSWRLILAPPEVLDAVVVHELAHLRVRGHSPAFWTLVEQHAPGTPAARRWLRAHARELRAALD